MAAIASVKRQTANGTPARPPRTGSAAALGLAAALALAASVLLTGCRQPKQTPTADGSLAAPGKAASVDRSWLDAAKSCWPQLTQSGYTDEDIARDLIHHLGAAFPTYAALNKKGGDADLSMPIATVLPPDVSQLEHSQTPVLTRGQAVAGTPAQGALVPSTNGNAPPDALCSIRSGIPQGFTK